MKIGFIGAGKMASALMKSALRAKLVKKQDMIASDRSIEQLNRIRKDLGVNITSSNQEVINFSDVVVLCVKPQDIEAALNNIKTKKKLFVSIAAGIRLKKLESLVGGRVVRVMPNTPCLVGAMAAGFTPGKFVGKKDIVMVNQILNTGGIAVQVAEKDLDAITGLSGSGPAFVAFLIQSFINGGIKQGLSEETAKIVTIQTFFGTALLLRETELSTKELIEMVSSPGGTTVAGRKILEESDLKEIIERTVDHATKRSKELGNE